MIGATNGNSEVYKMTLEERTLGSDRVNTRRLIPRPEEEDDEESDWGADLPDWAADDMQVD
jgi:hypothetical protein